MTIGYTYLKNLAIFTFHITFIIEIW